jgi:hypothetical protein
VNAHFVFMSEHTQPPPPELPQLNLLKSEKSARRTPTPHEQQQAKRISESFAYVSSAFVFLISIFVQLSSFLPFASKTSSKQPIMSGELGLQVINLSWLSWFGGLLMLFTALTTYTIARFTWRRRYPFSLLCKAGGRAPASYVFTAGFCISGTFMVASIFLSGNAIRSQRTAGLGSQSTSIIADLFGISSVVFGVLMALISVYEYESLHNWMAALFTGNGIIFQWLTYGVAKTINSPDWSNHSIRFGCAMLQTLLALSMFVCMQVEKTLNAMPAGGATPLSEGEPYSPSARQEREKLTFPDPKAGYAAVNTSLKMWSVLQYCSLTVCAVFFCSIGEFLQNCAVVVMQR